MLLPSLALTSLLCYNKQVPIEPWRSTQVAEGDGLLNH